MDRYIGDNAELEIIKEAAHVPQVEIPKEYNQRVLKFLTREPRSTKSSI
jgi:pimeloyl-ACP methyl ester carboxylesterase